jgi:hypothetical protein
MTAISTTSLPMTGGRRAALVIGVPVCLALVAGTGFSLVGNIGEGHYPVNKTVPASTTALTLNVNGQLTIRPTTASQATLTGTASYSLVRPALTEHTSAGATTLGYACAIPTGNCGLDATVNVPATVTTLTANSGAGDATVTGTTGPVKVSTGDGNVSVSHASGPLTLNTNSGSILVSAINKSPIVSASSGDGNIQAEGVASTTITANTDSGNINGSGIATAKITASTGNGDIQIVFTSVPRDVRVNSNSGSITLVLPPGPAEYNVTANTDSGSVSDTVPRNSSAPNTIAASSGSGSITIRQQ